MKRLPLEANLKVLKVLTILAVLSIVTALWLVPLLGALDDTIEEYQKQVEEWLLTNITPIEVWVAIGAVVVTLEQVVYWRNKKQ